MSDSYKDVPPYATKHNAENCPVVREILNIIGNKWSVLIIVLLEDGTLRFSELQRSISGISQRMLTLTLRELERNGLLTRTVEPTVPPSVYYALTPLGETLLVHAKALAFWSLENHPAIEKAREKFANKNP
ncbi:MAG: winged helix-turn-helix transcriptional regulator [Alphaproteobacteria bacterium]